MQFKIEFYNVGNQQKFNSLQIIINESKSIGKFQADLSWTE